MAQMRMLVRGPVVDATSALKVGGLRFFITGTLALQDGGVWVPTWTALAAEGALGLSDNE